MEVGYDGMLSHKDTDGSITRIALEDGSLKLLYYENSSTYTGQVTLGTISH